MYNLTIAVFQLGSIVELWLYSDKAVHVNVLSILLHHLDLRAVVQGQKHMEGECWFFVPLLVNQHHPVVLHLHTARNDGTQGRKRGHTPFNMACREVHR